MEKADWRERLIAAIHKDGRSYRALALAAGLGPNYVFQFIDRGTAPTMPGLLALCKVLEISPLYILTGVAATPSTDELISLVADMDPEQIDALVRLVRQMSPKQ